MSKEIRNIEPKALWGYFADLNEVPRPSKKEAKAVTFIKEFGESLGLETYVDPVGNIIIKKPASKGLEKASPVILQGHIDMVAQKNNDTDFDFNKMGIQMYLDKDGWVKAKGTTLGADNGIGVAAAMAVLADKKNKYPAIEALFTIDEETGMTGAFALQPGLMDGKILLNLDSEDEDEITIGCAGGIDVNISNTYSEQALSGKTKWTTLKLTVKGLKGGHSGMDIHKGRGNANKILARILRQLTDSLSIKMSNFDGGSLRNAIPREASAMIVFPTSKKDAFLAQFEELVKVIKPEYKTTDPNITIEFSKGRKPKKVMKKADQMGLLVSLSAAFSGIYRMSPDVDGLVQTSNNVARVLVKNGKIDIACLTRGSVDSEKLDCANAIKAAFELSGASVEFTGSYPGWAPEPNANVNAILTKMFKKRYKKDPMITACHAGLECGIIKKQYPDVEMISFGPNIRGAHSPDERVEVASVKRFYALLQDTLKSLGKMK